MVMADDEVVLFNLRTFGQAWGHRANVVLDFDTYKQFQYFKARLIWSENVLPVLVYGDSASEIYNIRPLDAGVAAYAKIQYDVRWNVGDCRCFDTVMPADFSESKWCNRCGLSIE